MGKHVRQVDRLDIIAEWLQGELDKADLDDNETMKALIRIIQPVADAYNIDTRPRDPGPAITVSLCHDLAMDRWWGHCEECSIVTPLWESANVVREALDFHISELHPHEECELIGVEVEL
mgnify:CR=1 FL=1